MSFPFERNTCDARPPRRFAVAVLLGLAFSLCLPAGSAFALGKRRPAAQVTVKKPTKALNARKRAALPARRVSAHGKQAAVRRSPAVVNAALPERPELLDLRANAAYVIDQDTQEVLLGKNATAPLPIASLTKLMTGVVIADARLPMDEELTITEDDIDRLKNSSSRLKVGTALTRGQALHLALMSSENRAAHALARTYPGGQSAFVSAMNVKARQFGMKATNYVEPTGLSSENRSTASDLAVLVGRAAERPLLRKLTTSPGYRLAVDGRTLQYVNSNGLVRTGRWDIDLQKTGYIREAGYNLVMRAELSGRKLIMVFLDSASKLTRIRDAELVRRWLQRHSGLARGKGGGES